MRIRAFPFPTSVREFVESHEPCYVVEQNRDGQLRSLIAIETGIARARMTSILEHNGLPLTAKKVVDAICHPEQSEGPGAAGPDPSVASLPQDDRRTRAKVTE